MTLRRLRLLTAGESHGPGLSGILDGLPADLRVSTVEVDQELARRQHGYGSGRRMLIERDRVVWTAGLRFGRTLGSPLAFSIPNRDWANWQERMSVEPVAPSRRPRPITLARPGHADLAGAIKYDTGDIRNVLERASARSTAPRVAAGAVCRQLLESCGVRIWSFVDQLGPVRAFDGTDEPASRVPAGWSLRDRLDPTPLRCPDAAAEAAMMAEVDAAIAAGDSVGGSFVVVAEGMPVGIGSNAEWDTRIDTAIAAVLMGIQAVKGVEIGIGFGAVGRRGCEVHDEVEPGQPGWERKTNRAGGTEGGMSNGAAIVARVGVKPVSTLRKPLDCGGPRDRRRAPGPHRAQRRGHHPAGRRRRRSHAGTGPRRRAAGRPAAATPSPMCALPCAGDGAVRTGPRGRHAATTGSVEALPTTRPRRPPSSSGTDA